MQSSRRASIEADLTLPRWVTFSRGQLLDELETLVEPGGKVIDWHSCELFPERWIDLVIVTRCDHAKLWERLEKRCAVFSLLDGFRQR
jgi:adenylate kinase